MNPNFTPHLNHSASNAHRIEQQRRASVRIRIAKLRRS
jgi:hypothetical protein